MSDTVVVIATNGGVAMLEKSLPLMKKWLVLVVETNPHACTATRYLCDSFPNVVYMRTPYRGYDTGAYLWAYWNVVAKNYLFLQDSCFPRASDFVEQFQQKMPSDGWGVVGWSSFDINIWDSTQQYEATEWMYGERKLWPPKGIFGPIFMTSRLTLDHLAKCQLLPMPPVHKEQQQAMERAWAILFHRAGIPMAFLRDETAPHGYDMEQGLYPALTKKFKVRT